MRACRRGRDGNRRLAAGVAAGGLRGCGFRPVGGDHRDSFHWERREDQKFKGTLRIIDEGEHLTAVNVLPLEEYLLSVISSEMKATSNLELLKAHAVISRSWLLAQKAKAARVISVLRWRLR